MEWETDSACFRCGTPRRLPAAPRHDAAQYLHSRLWVQRIGVPLLGKLLAAGEHAECVGLPGAKLGEHVDLVVERLPCQGWVRGEVLRLRPRQLEGIDVRKE